MYCFDKIQELYLEALVVSGSSFIWAQAQLKFEHIHINREK